MGRIYCSGVFFSVQKAQLTKTCMSFRIRESGVQFPMPHSSLFISFKIGQDSTVESQRYYFAQH